MYKINRTRLASLFILKDINILDALASHNYF